MFGCAQHAHHPALLLLLLPEKGIYSVPPRKGHPTPLQRDVPTGDFPRLARLLRARTHARLSSPPSELSGQTHRPAGFVAGVEAPAGGSRTWPGRSAAPSNLDASARLPFVPGRSRCLSPPRLFLFFLFFFFSGFVTLPIRQSQPRMLSAGSAREASAIACLGAAAGSGRAAAPLQRRPVGAPSPQPRWAAARSVLAFGTEAPRQQEPGPRRSCQLWKTSRQALLCRWSSACFFHEAPLKPLRF